MSKKPLTFFERVIYIFICGAFLFLLVFIGYRYVFSDGSASIAVPVGVSERVPDHRVEFTEPEFDSVSYYRPIIEYNLFRPLGWTPPRRVEPYRLIGTILPHDAHTPPKAIIETTAGNQKTYIVSTGDKLSADTEVVSIQPKQVTLSTNGQQRSLSLNADLWIQ